MNKHLGYEKNLLKFLKQMKKLLEEFGVKPITIRIRNVRTGLKGELRINNILKLETFSKEIGFKHIKRKKRLKLRLNSTRKTYKKGESEKLILGFLKECPYSTIEISKKIKRSRNNVARYLRKLEKENKIKRLFKTRHKTEVTWASKNFKGNYIPHHDPYNAIPLILRNGPKTTKEIGEIIGIHRTQAGKYLRKHKKEGVVKILKRTKKGYLWCVSVKRPSSVQT